MGISTGAHRSECVSFRVLQRGRSKRRDRQADSPCGCGGRAVPPAEVIRARTVSHSLRQEEGEERQAGREPSLFCSDFWSSDDDQRFAKSTMQVLVSSRNMCPEGVLNQISDTLGSSHGDTEN
jgi:hypothetical protein